MLWYKRKGLRLLLPDRRCAQPRADGEEEEAEADDLGEDVGGGYREDDGALALRIVLGEEGRMINERSKSRGRARHVHEVPVRPPEAVEWAKVALLVLLEIVGDGVVHTAFMDDMEGSVRADSGRIIAISELHRLRRSCGV